MSRTGYTAERAAPHEWAVDLVIAELRDRGYGCRELPVNDHRPDAQLDGGDYVEVKTGGPNLAIEVNSVHAYQRIQLLERRRVYLVYVPNNPDPASWLVLTPETIRIMRGPSRSSGNGSNDDWYLCAPDGTPFNLFFTKGAD